MSPIIFFFHFSLFCYIIFSTLLYMLLQNYIFSFRYLKCLLLWFIKCFLTDMIQFSTQNLNPPSFSIFPQRLYKSRESLSYSLKLRPDVYHESSFILWNFILLPRIMCILLNKSAFSVGLYLLTENLLK